MKRKGNALKTIFLLGILGLATILTPRSVDSNMSSYCSIPPFIVTASEPSVLIVLDNSGSMNDQAYASGYDPTQFTQGQYYGYFDPSKNYIYGSNGRWEVTTLPMTDGTTSNPIASGDFLNWATTRRTDAAKKLLVGGKASPRSPAGAITVKLYGEDSSSSWNFTKTYDTTGQNLVYPFEGNYDFNMSGDQLRISLGSVSANNAYPNGNISVPSEWSVVGAPSAYEAVDDVSSDEDSTYIEPQNTTDPVILDYDYTGPRVDTIYGVSVVVRARKTSSGGTRRIRGVIRVNGTDWESSFSNLTTSWNNYSFTWDVNPDTDAAWQWSDIKSDILATLDGFGAMARRNYSSNYPRMTQIYLVISTSPLAGGPYNIIVDQGMVKAEGILDTLSSDVRFGLAYYNYGCGQECGYSDGRRDGGEVENYVDFGSTTDMIVSVSNKSPTTWTPLGETLYEMVRYFRQDSPYYSNSPADYQTGLNYDPFYFQYSKLSGSNLPDQYVSCAKSFILMLTDGESTMDENMPSAYQDYDNDGNDPGSYPSRGTDYLDDVALWARTADARPGSCTSTPTSFQQCLPGNQNIYIYSVFMFGRGSNLLMDAAINGGFEDFNGDGLPGPALEEYRRDSNKDGILTSDDLPLTYYEGDDGYELESSIISAIEDILRRTASGTAASVLTTSSRGLGSLLQAYFLPQALEGTKEISWVGYLQNIWLDSDANLREDTVQDFKLNLGDDDVLKLYFDESDSQTKGALFTTDVNGEDGTLATCTPSSIESFSNLDVLWKAGEKLANKAPSTRDIFTSKKIIRGTTTTNTFSDSGGHTHPEFDTAMEATLRAALNVDGFCSVATSTACVEDSNCPPGETCKMGVDDIVGYIRGECLETGVTGDLACGSTLDANFRDRRVDVGGSLEVWKLGDIISSTPKVFANSPINTYIVDYGDLTYWNYVFSDSYKKKSSVAFTGANDGMVHAFKVGYLKDKDEPDPPDGTGELPDDVKAIFKDSATSLDTSTPNTLGDELWAYIPYNAFPYLKYLADPGYCHIYYADLSVRLIDASVNGAATSARACDDFDNDPNACSWRTLLVGGMRFGGACGPGGSPADPPVGTPADVGFSSYFAIDITDPENPVPLWEFSDDDMGYATTYASIMRTGDSGDNGNWYVAFGSGSKQLPQAMVDIARSIPGYVYVLDLKTGELVKKILLDHNAIVGDILAIDADKDYHSEKIYFGTSYDDGAGNWIGKLMKIDIPDEALTDMWSPTPTTLFSGVYPFTASPEATMDQLGRIWVYEGSGKFYSALDGQDTSQQIFIGLKDISSISYPLTMGNLTDRTNHTTDGTVLETKQMCLFDIDNQTFSNQDVVTVVSISPGSVVGVPPSGWSINLQDSGERVISRALAIGGLVDFVSYVPNQDLCAFGGDTLLYSVSYNKGVAPANPSIRSPDITTGSSGDITVLKRIKLGPGAPPTGDAIIVPPIDVDDDDSAPKKIQVGTGAIAEAENKPPIPIKKKIMHWLKK